jgi:hypothetical protein
MVGGVPFKPSFGLSGEETGDGRGRTRNWRETGHVPSLLTGIGERSVCPRFSGHDKYGLEHAAPTQAKTGLEWATRPSTYPDFIASIDPNCLAFRDWDRMSIAETA